MNTKTPTWAAILVLAILVPVAAQQPSPDRWHLTGSVGLNLSRTTQNTLFPSLGTFPASNYDTIAGDLGLSLNGFWRDPQLLPFSIDFAGERGSNTVGLSGYRNLLTNAGVNTTFLPRSNYPFRFFYRASQMDTSGGSFGQTSDNSALGLDWTLRLPHLPRITTGYTRLANLIHIPTSLFDTDYKQGHSYVGADDAWKAWTWNAGFDHYSNTSNFTSGGFLPGDFAENLNAFGAHVRREFSNHKAEFNADHRSQWRDDTYGNFGTAHSADYYTAASLRIALTPKLTSSYFYDFVRVTFGGSFASGGSPVSRDGLILLNAQTFDSHYGGGRLDYRWTDNIRVFETVRYQRVTPTDHQIEFRESLLESLPGISYHRRWRGFDLAGEYVGHFQSMGTNLGNHSQTFSNDMQGMAGWGSFRRIRLVASGSYAKLSLVEQLNGFNRESRYRLEGETRALPHFALRVAADHSDTEILNLSGDISQRNTVFSVQADHSRFSLGFSHSFGDGAGAVFPQLTQLKFVISNPLPTDQLVRSPLLNREVHANTAALILRLRRNLDLSASWRTEDNLLGGSVFNFTIIEVRARYRIGKITLDSAYGKYRNENQISASSTTGLLTNRYWLRISRDFRLF